jgi:3-methyladenine DNA glycosylase AlkD
VTPAEIRRHVAALRTRFEGEASATRAAHEKRYLKSDLAFIGVTMPMIRKAARDWAKSEGTVDRAGLHALVEALWKTDTHELRSVAIGILERRADLLTPADLDWLIDLVDRANTWAHVDWLAIKVIGALVARAPGLQKHLDRWAKHDNFWVRRTALLALHDPLAAGGGDFDHFARLAQPMLGEKEFFIRKAIGWVLRTTAKRTPARTAGFVAAHAGQMAGLTFREAVRALPAAEQKRLTALRARAAAR